MCCWSGIELVWAEDVWYSGHMALDLLCECLILQSYPRDRRIKEWQVEVRYSMGARPEMSKDSSVCSHLATSVKRPAGFWALLCLLAGAKGPEAGKRLPLPEGMALTCQRAARRANSFWSSARRAHSFWSSARRACGFQRSHRRAGERCRKFGQKVVKHAQNHYYWNAINDLDCTCIELQNFSQQINLNHHPNFYQGSLWGLRDGSYCSLLQAITPSNCPSLLQRSFTTTYPSTSKQWQQAWM